MNIEPEGRLLPDALRALRHNVLAGLRLALFLPVRPEDYRARPIDFAVVIALDIALWILAAGLRVGFEGEFDANAIPTYLVGVPLVLAAAMVVSMVYRQPHALMPVAVALVASDPTYELAGLALPWLAMTTGLGSLILYFYLVWVWAVSLRAVAVMLGRQQPQFRWSSVTVTALLAIGFFLLPKIEVWAPPAADEAPAARLAQEAAFHRQGELIREALEAVQKGVPGRPELYFVGFAPDASQDVFLKEMRFVRRLFEERFGAAGRSAVLANSHTALEELPIASTTNLGRVLERAGKSMNTEEDVLFLFLSAHGDAGHRLTASQPPLELASLTPPALARMLLDSGVRWKVIVVSACYSGGYIEPLRDANTVIITAAAADRTSFGCETGRDFTYFGEAFFRDALAKTGSFTEAFELAKATVTEREKKEGLTPSQPQLWVGPAAAAHLKKLAEQPN